MRVGIDLTPFFTGSRYRGIGMYTREFIKQLVHIQDNTTYHFLNIYGKYEGDPILDEKCFLYEYYTGPQCSDIYDRQLFFSKRTEKIIRAEVQHFLEQSNIDVMLFTSPNEYGGFFNADWFDGVMKVSIVYDFIPLIFPEQYLSDEAYRVNYMKSIEFLKSMDLLLTISQSTKDDAVRLLGIPENKIKVIYAGIDERFCERDKYDLKKLKRKYKIADSFLMFAGGIDFKKNIKKLIIAFSKLPKSLLRRYQLIVIGKASDEMIQDFMETAIAHGVDEKVVCTGYIPIEDLAAMYYAADLMVFPSLYEGFGMPVIEAMACGTPVVTSNVSSLKEIAQGHAVLVDPKSVKSILKGMVFSLRYLTRTKKLARVSVKYARSFTWRKTVYLAYEAMQCLKQQNSKKQKYEFTVSEQDLRNIVEVFVSHNVLFTDSHKKAVADELAMLEKHSLKRVKEFKKRILYDVTVLEKWMKAEYFTGIARASIELYKGLQGRTTVIPVVVRRVNRKTIVDAVEIDTWLRTEENMELKENDVYIMPELQLRGIQVEKKHPNRNKFKQYGIPCYAVIYDILPLRMPQFFERKTCEAFVPYMKEILNDYDGILCDSKWAADDVIAYCRENKQQEHMIKIGYYHLGSDSFINKREKSISNKIIQFMKDTEPVFIMIGTIEPRKGHKMVLKAFEKMWQEGFLGKICFAGHIGWNMETFAEDLKKHTEKGKKLEFFEAVNDAEVEYMYRNADALIQASSGEGFGLPLIEAGRFHLPVICSDLEVFHEVAGNHAVYFEKENEAGLKEKIKEFVQLKRGDKVPDSGKIERVSWEEAADKVYDMICNDQNWYSRI